MKYHSSSSISCDHLHQLISHIYDAALEPKEWGALLGKLTCRLKAEQAYMRTINTKTNSVQRSYCHNKDADWMNAYKEYYIHLDPWLNDLLNAKDTFISCTHHILTNKEYESMEFHRDFVGPQGTHYGLGGIIDAGKNLTNFLSFNRDKNRRPFDNIHLEALQILVPHIQKALLINEKTYNIDLENDLLRNALNHINNPIILVNNNGNILFINSQAEQLIQQQSGISILNNHILIQSHVENKKLQKLIHQATQKLLGQGGAMAYTDPISQTSLSILVTPVNPDKANIDTQSNENALLMLSANDHQQSISSELLMALYKLSPAEARLTEYLCQGLTLNEISENVFLSKNTLRTQLRSCFNKTGVSRQAELVRLVSIGPAGNIKTTV